MSPVCVQALMKGSSIWGGGSGVELDREGRQALVAGILGKRALARATSQRACRAQGSAPHVFLLIRAAHDCVCTPEEGTLELRPEWQGLHHVGVKAGRFPDARSREGHILGPLTDSETTEN